MESLSDIFDKITCSHCRKALEACPRNDLGFPNVQRVYAVGLPAAPDMGHALYHSATGRVALCIAPRKKAIK